MLTNEYLKRVYAQVEKRDGHEPEFLQAVREVFESLELVIDKHPEWEKNALLEENFENAKCTFDTNMNRYVNKKKSSGKVDMVVALINAAYMLQQNTMFDEAIDWAVQII